jgi:glycosyltransferase involved in cell wall biosynthesis
MPLVSATIITQNEAPNIARCIRSLRCADEVVVVDAGSTDDTPVIAEGLGARVVAHPWTGFASQKNCAVRCARHDWILSLDADEELDRVAISAVLGWKASEPVAAGYRFARRARYLGRWIRHSGWYPDYKLRLFDRRKGRWAGNYVHESVRVEGPVATLPGEILHYTCDSLADHRQRIELYTDLAAAELREQGKRIGLFHRQLDSWWTFAQIYFLRRGFLDGVQGFWIAYMASRYVGKKYAKCAQLAAKENR